MWILPSRLRPHNIKRFIEGWEKTKSSTKLVLALDADDPKLNEYKSIKLPKKWTLRVVPKRLSLMAIYNWVYRQYSFEPWYGIIDDDYVPLSDHWDTELVEAAGKNKIAYPKNNITGPESVVCPVIPARIVRKMGWVMPPFTKRLYGDNVWTEIGRKEKCLVYRDDIEIRHYHFSNGLAEFDETYAKPSAKEDQEAFYKWLEKYNPAEPINIVTVNCGDYCGRGAEYTNILFDSITRNLSDKTPGKFTVFTDEPDSGYKYTYGINVKYIPSGLSHLKGWWNKLYLFSDGIFNKDDMIFYFDLDTAIVSGLDEIVKYRGDFAMLRDFYRPAGLGSGVMAWRSGKNSIWPRFMTKGLPQDNPGGDQSFIEECVKDGIIKQPDILQDLYPEQFVSYKVHAQFDPPKNAKVVCFHGYPKPHEVLDGWVPCIWKIGGGSVIEFDYIPNVPVKKMHDNIAHSMALPFEQLGQNLDAHDNHLCIVGGGPSIKDHLDELKVREKRGQVIWALNNSFNYLRENGIYPHAQVILDARDKNAEFVPESTYAMLLYSSICDPEVFRRAATSGGHVIIWHPMVEGIGKFLDGKDINAISCGDTVGLKAMGLAFLFGFRNIHLFGYDSSYRGDENHAYPQELNNGERVIEVTVNGHKFKTAAWMASQTQQFKEYAPILIGYGMTVTVHGDGLLPYVATLLSTPQQQAVE